MSKKKLIIKGSVEPNVLSKSKKMIDTRNPLFSIITVCKNSEKTIERTIDSIRKNERKLFQFIIIDGKSTDHTCEIIKNNLDIVDTYISESDKGLYDAMNKGLQYANGEFVIFINSDDWLEDNVLAKVSNAIHNNPGYDIYHGYITINKSDNSSTTVVGHQTLPTSIPSYQPASFVRKKSILTEVWFDTKYKIAADFKFFKHLERQGYKFFNMNFCVTNFSLGGASSNLKLRFNELDQILSEFNYSKWLVWLLILRLRIKN
jgi:glycosyltransferase involved in cell wall biosynthesis